jgi:hypothetical protein
VESKGKIALVHTDSQITLQLLQKRKIYKDYRTN